MIGTMHGKVYYPEKKRRIRMLRFAAALSSRIITVSEELNLFLNDLLKLQDDSKIVTLYNGISLDRYQPSESTAAVRKKFDLPHDTAVIGTVGSMIKVKGINYLLEAVAILKEEHPNLRLLIAGEGNQMDKLIAQSHDLGLTDEVRFLGFRNDVPDILDALDVYVCSSLSEGHSLSILEAMAMGKPIVATDVGGNPELVIPEANGILVAPQNPEAIAEAVSGLLEDRSRMMSMGEQSRRMVQQRFSLERMVSDYMDIYERYIGQ
jgi:glycosyltransferase involved in cell wall biosynthesis